MPEPTPIADPKKQASDRVFNALDGLGLDLAQKVGILETVKHTLLRKALDEAEGEGLS